jgi:hypothetical protein
LPISARADAGEARADGRKLAAPDRPAFRRRSHGKASPDARLMPGVRASISSGLGPLFNGPLHGQRGLPPFRSRAKALRSEFTVERPAIGRP